MTQGKAPLHGGTQRIAFDGGQTVRKSLPFRAVSVNIDNWSPYWYKLNPIEEYIPPFQNGVNIRLPLITDFEFVCQAPPGIDQPTIVTTSGIAGNTTPVIAVFSSFDTNNDAGTSALEQAANKSFAQGSLTGTPSVTLATIDVTLYNGVYFYAVCRSTASLNITFTFPGSAGTIETYTMYRNERILFTIPKLGNTLTVTATSNSGALADVDFIYRPFLGYADFSAIILGGSGANPPSLGDRLTVVGSGSITFNVNGVIDAFLTIVQTNSGLASSDRVWVKVTASNYSSNVNTGIIHSHVYMVGGAQAPLKLPLSLQGQFNTIIVSIINTNAAATTEVGLHHISNPMENFNTQPSPYHLGFQNAGVQNGLNVYTTFPVGGYLTGLNLSIISTTAAAGTYLQLLLGTPAAAIIPLIVIPATVVDSYTIYFPRPILMDTGFSTIWTNTNAALFSVFIGNTFYVD